MRTIRGPGLFLAQFAGEAPPFDGWEAITHWAAGLGYAGVQVPSGARRLIDLDAAAASRTWCEDWAGRGAVAVTELSAHVQGQLVAVHPAYDGLFDAFAPEAVRGRPAARTEWAVDQVRKTLTASHHLGLTAMAAFSGGLAWPYLYPWPQRPPGLVEEAFAELARRWRPILDHAEACGVDVCFELHPGEDLHDGASFERFLDAVDGHPRACLLYDPSHFVLQGLDYLAHLDLYAARIRMVHVKDAEFRPDGRQGVYGGFQPWTLRAGRFRSPGDGQVDFGAVFARLAAMDFPGWAVVEWECCLKDAEVGAREGADFVRRHIIPVARRAFDDFAGTGTDAAGLRRLMGIAP